MWRSKTVQGEGYNELSMEDQKNKEVLYLRAQRDLKTEVLHDDLTSVITHQRLDVEQARFAQIQQDQHGIVEEEVTLRVAQDYSGQVDALQQQMGTKYVSESQEILHLSSGDLQVLTTEVDMSLKVGESFITLNGEGVFLVGEKVNVATSGHEIEPTILAAKEAELPLGGELPAPNEVVEPEPEEMAVSAQQSTLITAAESGLPICEECVAAENAG